MIGIDRTFIHMDNIYMYHMYIYIYVRKYVYHHPYSISISLALCRFQHPSGKDSYGVGHLALREFFHVRLDGIFMGKLNPKILISDDI